MTAHAVQPERGEADQHRIDLGVAALPTELEATEQRPTGEQTRAWIPQALAEIHHQGKRAQSGKQRWQQESDTQIADELVAESDQPHEQRWFIGVQFAIAPRKQPIATV